jgi:hypothetical protein
MKNKDITIVLPYFSKEQDYNTHQHRQNSKFPYDLDIMSLTTINNRPSSNVRCTRHLSQISDYGDVHHCTVLLIDEYLNDIENNPNSYLIISLTWGADTESIAQIINSTILDIFPDSLSDCKNLSLVITHDKEHVSAIFSGSFYSAITEIADELGWNDIFKRIIIAPAEFYLVDGCDSNPTKNINQFQDIIKEQSGFGDDVTTPIVISDNFFINEFNKTNQFINLIDYYNHASNLDKREYKYQILCLTPKIGRFELLYKIWQNGNIKDGNIAVALPPYFDSLAKNGDISWETIETIRKMEREYNPSHTARHFRKIIKDEYQNIMEDNSQIYTKDKLEQFVCELNIPQYHTTTYDCNGTEHRYSPLIGFEWILETLGDYTYQHILSDKERQDTTIKEIFLDYYFNKTSSFPSSGSDAYGHQKISLKFLSNVMGNLVQKVITSYNFAYNRQINLPGPVQSNEVQGNRWFRSKYTHRRAPTLADSKINYIDVAHVSTMDYITYNKSYFSVVFETLEYEQNKLNGVSTFFPTEKTFKAIALMHPFIILSTPNALKVLRSKGFKTFNGFIDESYDLIDNAFERRTAIADEINRLCKMSLHEFHDWYKKLYPILDFNRRHLQTRQPDLITSLRQL